MLDEIGPDGVPLWRNASDVMNNYFIDYVAKSFTDRGNIELAQHANYENRLQLKK